MSRRSVEGSFSVLSFPRLFYPLPLSLSLTHTHNSPFSSPFIFSHFSFSFLFFPVISFLFPLIILIFAICLSTKASRRNGESSFSPLSLLFVFSTFAPRFLFFPLLLFLSSSICLSRVHFVPLIISRLRNLPIYDGLLEFVSIENASRSLRPFVRCKDSETADEFPNTYPRIS